MIFRIFRGNELHYIDDVTIYRHSMIDVEYGIFSRVRLIVRYFYQCETDLDRSTLILLPHPCILNLCVISLQMSDKLTLFSGKSRFWGLRCSVFPAFNYKEVLCYNIMYLCIGPVTLRRVASACSDV